MEKAIDRVAADDDPRDQMEIHASLALSLMFTAGNSERVRDAFNTALALAEQREDAYQQLRLLSGLSMYLHRTIDAAGTLEVARRVCREQDGKSGRCSACGFDAGGSVLHACGPCPRAKIPRAGTARDVGFATVQRNSISV
jgi:hypothetical protein